MNPHVFLATATFSWHQLLCRQLAGKVMGRSVEMGRDPSPLSCRDKKIDFAPGLRNVLREKVQKSQENLRNYFSQNASSSPFDVESHPIYK